jgi:hypothetical protein
VKHTSTSKHRVTIHPLGGEECKGGETGLNILYIFFHVWKKKKKKNFLTDCLSNSLVK